MRLDSIEPAIIVFLFPIVLSYTLAMAASKTPNGTAEAPIEVSTLPPVVGINFGNSYASIAVFTKVRRVRAA